MSGTATKKTVGGERKLFGMLAEFSSPEHLLEGCRKVRDAGFQRWDSHSPFPVHGIDPAMGIKKTVLPWLVFVGGLTGLGAALLMQWWMNAVDYPLVISGKPLFSLPANIPIVFELTVLFAALTTFFGMFGLNRLPELYNPLFGTKSFKKVTNDGFFISIMATDPRFDAEGTRQLLTEVGAVSFEDVFETIDDSAKLPSWAVTAAVSLVIASLLPILFVAKIRASASPNPPIVLSPHMEHQPRYRTQGTSAFFADGRSMRPRIEGTVAVEDETPDPGFMTGKENGEYLRGFPAHLATDATFMARGQERYRIYCTPCHGLGGEGDGIVSKRAEALQEGTWVVPTSVHADHLQIQPVGQLFETVTNGIRTMPGYGDQMPPKDRWAVVFYMKALQKSWKGTLEDLPENVRAQFSK